MQVTIKTTFNGDTRRRSIARDTAKFADLCSLVSETYHLPANSFALRYVDEDGDNITLGSDLELKEALSMIDNSTLRLSVVQIAAPSPIVASVVAKSEENANSVDNNNNDEAAAAVDASNGFVVMDQSMNDEEKLQLEAAIKASLEETMKKSQSQQESNDAEPLNVLKTFVQELVSNAKLALSDDDINALDDNNNNDDDDDDDDEDLSKVGDALRQFFTGLGSHIESVASASKDAASPHIAAVRAAVEQLVERGVVARAGLADVYAALARSPRQVQQLVADLVLLAQEQSAAIEQAARCGVAQLSGSKTRHAAICDSCQSTIVGVRYKCANCADYDLCASCEARNASGAVHDRTHVFLKLTMPLPRRDGFLLPNLYNMKARPCPSWMAGRRQPTAVANASPSSSSAAAASSAPPQKRALVARFVRDVTISDSSVMAPNTDFVKIWTVRNSGDSAWPAGCRAVFVGGDGLSDFDAAEPLPEVAAGQEVDIAVDMRTPSRAGRYTSFWRMASPQGARFGHRLWCNVHVDDVVDDEAAAVVVPAAVDAEEDAVKSVDESMMSQIERSFQKLDQVEQVEEEEQQVEEEVKEEEVEEEVKEEVKEEVVEEAMEEVEEQPSPLMFTSQLRQLTNMGFGDESRNSELLKRHSGDVLATVQELLADH